MCGLQGSSLGRIQGVPYRMNGAGEREREKTRETSLDRAKSARERERERERASEQERENDQTGVFAGSGRVWQCFIFHHQYISKGKIV